MSQIAQLSEAEIEDRFHITSRTAIHFTLAAFVREHASFTVQFGPENETFVTTLLAVQAEQNRLVFDCSGSTEANSRILASPEHTFLGRPGGIPVQFASGPALEISHQGGKALAVDLPKVLIRLQRREYFRIEIPRSKGLLFFGRLPSGELLKLPAHDISVSGIGLDADKLPDNLAVEQLVQNCHFMLPGEVREFFFSATIRRIIELETRSGTRYWRLGLQFNDLTAGDENRVQRYIARIERERHELS